MSNNLLPLALPVRLALNVFAVFGILNILLPVSAFAKPESLSSKNDSVIIASDSSIYKSPSISQAVEKTSAPIFPFWTDNDFSSTSLFNFAMRNHRSLSGGISNAAPPCELDYDNFGPPIRIGASGGTGNFPTYDRYGTGPCPNPSVVPRTHGLTITYIGNPPTPYSWEVYFRVAPNLTGFSRTIDSTINTNGVPTGSVRIIQSGECAFDLKVRYGTPFFSGAGGTEELELTAAPNCPTPYLTTDAPWLHIAGTTLTVDYVQGSANSDLGERSGNVLVMVNGSPSPAKLQIIQFKTQKPVIIRPTDKSGFINNGRRSAIAIGVRG